MGFMGIVLSDSIPKSIFYLLKGDYMSCGLYVDYCRDPLLLACLKEAPRLNIPSSPEKHCPSKPQRHEGFWILFQRLGLWLWSVGLWLQVVGFGAR